MQVSSSTNSSIKNQILDIVIKSVIIMSQNVHTADLGYLGFQDYHNKIFGSVASKLREATPLWRHEPLYKKDANHNREQQNGDGFLATRSLIEMCDNNSNEVERRTRQKLCTAARLSETIWF